MPKISKKLNISVVFAFLALFFLTHGAHAERKIFWNGGMNLGYSSGHQKITNDIFDEGSGGFFLTFETGLEIVASRHFSILPNIGFQLSPYSVKRVTLVAADGSGSVTYGGETSDTSESTVDSVLLPEIAARYYFNPRSDTKFYLDSGILFHSARTDSRFYSLEKRGVGFGASLGVLFSQYFTLSLDYKYLPVNYTKAQASTSSLNSTIVEGSETEKGDMGGLSISAGFRF